jgi:hypothetical protein
MKQDALRVGMTWGEVDEDWRDWVRIGGEPFWRGPSSPRDTVFHVPAGDLVVVWDVRHQFVWEASVSLGRATVERWYDEVIERERIGPALWMTPVAAFPTEVEDDERNAITRTGRVTLHRVKLDVGLALWRGVVAAAVEDVLDPELRGRRRSA